MTWCRLQWSVYVAIALAACGDDPPKSAAENYATLPFLGSCATASNETCKEGECLEASGQRICTKACTSDADCGSGHFCVEGLCEPTCDHVVREGKACVDGKLEDCAADGSPDCSRCGCPDGSACRGAVCAVLLAPGEACEDNTQCASDFCHKGKCHVGQGQPCAEGGCTACDTSHIDEQVCAQCVIVGEVSTCVLPCTLYADLNYYCIDGSGMTEPSTFCINERRCAVACEKNEDCHLPFERCVEDPFNAERKFCSSDERPEGTPCEDPANCADGLDCAGDPLRCTAADGADGGA